MFELPLLNTIILLSSGKHYCQKCDKFLRFYSKLSNLLKITESKSSFYEELSESSDTSNIDALPLGSPEVRGINRIGPHAQHIYSIIFGSLLGDGIMVKEKGGSRMMFYQSEGHSDYLLWLHSELSKWGYCLKTPPVLRSRVFKDGKIGYFMRFESFTYTSFNWIWEEFYPKGRKVVPLCITDYLTPLALAIWAMVDGCKLKNKGFKFAKNSFTLKETKFLADILNKKYKLKVSIIKTGAVNQYNIYIIKSSMDTFIEIVKPHMHSSIIYKLYDL